LNLKRNLNIIILILIIILPLITFLMISYFMYIPTPLKIIHVNPSTEASRLPPPKHLVQLILNPFAVMLGGNFSKVPLELRALELAYIPSNLRYIIDRFIQLMNDVSNHLDSADKLMDNAEELIGVGRGVEAKPLLMEASMELASANLTCRELRMALGELTRSFNIPYYDVYLKLNELDNLINNMYRRMMSLLDRIEGQGKLIETSISIDAEPKTSWTGGRITVRGILYASSEPLPNRNVTVIVEGLKTFKAITCGDGSFETKIDLPYIYKPTITIQAKYTPMGIDSEKYKPSISNKVEINLMYIEPKIKIIQIPETVLPGKTFEIKGNIISAEQIPYGEIKVSWINQAFNVKLGDDGFFEATLYTPGEIPDGRYFLTVEAPASSVFAPAKEALSVMVKRMPISLSIDIPSSTLAGLSTTISGSFKAGEEYFNATVKAYFAGNEYTVESSGSFTITLSIPITIPSGYQTVKLYITPRNPWISEATYEKNILVVNPLTIIASIAITVILTIKTFRGRLITTKQTMEAERIVEYGRGGEVRRVEVEFTPKEYRWLIDLYWEAVEIVSKMTGIAMEPHMTMREYLSATASKLGKLSWCFETLTSAAERALYSTKIPEPIISKAKDALEDLRRGA